MNLHRPNANDVFQTRNRSRHIASQSGICSRCLDGCKGCAKITGIQYVMDVYRGGALEIIDA